MATSTRKQAARRTSGATAKKTPAKKAPKKRAARPAAARGNGATAPVSVAPRERAAQSPKPPKLKLVRDSFTIPRDEYGVIDALKLRAARLGRIAKKSELLRAGLKLLAACTDAGLLGALDAVPPVKTGRPKGKRHGKDTADDATAG